jgi:hypothetical protein
MAVFLIFVQARAILRRIRELRTESVRQVEWVGPITWRLAAIALLAGFVSAEWSILRVDYLSLTSPSRWPSTWESNYSEIYRMREGLFPICGLLAMLGLVLGIGGDSILDMAKTGRPRPYWLFVPLAALASILFVAQPGWWSLIPQLVLIAIEAVWNAMHHSFVARPSLSARLLRGGIDAGSAGLVCLMFSLIVAHDFERAHRREPWARSRRSWLLRLFFLVSTIACGTYVGLVTIPAIDRHLANGFRHELGPLEVSMLLGGFGLFSAGLAARSIGGISDRERPRWSVRLSTGLQLVVLGLVLISALKYLPSSMQFDPSVPTFVGGLVDAVAAIQARLRNHLPDPLVGEVEQWLGTDHLVWVLTMSGFTIAFLELILKPNSQPLPFRIATESPAQAGRLAWLTVALSVVSLAAVPILLVVGQALVHIQLRAADFATFGWPRLF